MDKCKGGRGPEGKPASCIWFTRPFLFCPPLVLNLKTWLPGVPPLLPPPPSPLKSLCYVHSCTVHITSAAPSYSPTTAPPCRPAIAEHVPPPTPSEKQQLFPLQARACPDTQAGSRAPTGGHMPFFSSPFPFSHIIQFLPLLFALRKILWPYDPMKA